MSCFRKPVLQKLCLGFQVKKQSLQQLLIQIEQHSGRHPDARGLCVQTCKIEGYKKQVETLIEQWFSKIDKKKNTENT